MPSARIIGQLPEAAQSFLQQLRERGYEIEAVSANDAVSSYADLEITLQECPSDDVPNNVAALANGEDVNVVVSPGALRSVAHVTSEEPQSIQGAEPVAEEFDVPEVIAEQPQAVFEEEVHLAGQQAAAADEGRESELAEMLLQPMELSTPILEEVTEQSCLQYATEELEPAVFDRQEPELEQPVEAEVSSEALQYAELFQASEDLPRAEQEQSRFAASPNRMAPPESNAFQSSQVFSDWPIWNVSAPDESVPETVAQPRRLRAYLNRLKPHADRFVAQVVRVQAQANRSMADLWSAWQRVLATGNATRILRNDRLFTRVATGATGIAVVLLLVAATAHRFSPLPAGIVEGSSEALRPVPFQKSVSTNVAADTSQAAPPLSPTLTGLKHLRGSAVSAVPVKLTSHRSVADNEFVAKNTVVRYTQHIASGIAGEVQQPGVKYYTDLKENR